MHSQIPLAWFLWVSIAAIVGVVVGALVVVKAVDDVVLASP